MLLANIKKLIKRYFQNFAYFYQKLGYRIFIRVSLNIAVGFLDGLGLAMFLPLLQMVDGSQHLKPDKMGNLGFLIKGMEAVGFNLTLLNVLIVLCIFFVFKGLALFISSMYEVMLRQYFVKTLRRKLTLLMSEMSYKSFVVSDVGTIQNALSAEVARLSTAYQQYFGSVQQVVMVLVYMLFAFFVDAKFALLICVGGGLTSFIYKRVYAGTKAASKKLTFESNYYQGLIMQYVSSFKYLKATGLLKQYSNKLLNTISHIESNNRKIGKLGAIVSATREPLLIFVVCIVILLQVNVLGGALATILISLLFFYRALSALMLMQVSYNGFLGVSGSMENMNDFEKYLKGNREVNGKLGVEKFVTQIELKDANFSYNSERMILKDINLKIPKNRTIAFIGESGSGKTTIVNVLAGLIPLNDGELLIDGVNRKELDINTYQRRIGYITQDPVIFSDTIFNNVTFWAAPSADAQERFNLAIKQASLEDFIENLPQKGETVLGNNGVNLSGGQRQRISIARELYKDVDILILDEATSALDSETEKSIQRNIEQLQGRYTVLIVAHRLSTVKNADSIVIMDNGQVAESGSFAELVESSPKFKRMIALQEL